MNEPPFVRDYNLGRLPQAGEMLAIAASEAERAALARWADLEGVERWEARVSLRKLSPSRFALEATLVADVIQACVVTLAPVPSHIERHFIRELRFTGAPRRGHAPPASAPIVVEEPAVASEDAPDEIESLHYDLADPLLEEFSLALDPYPRAPGVAFQPPADPEGAVQSPFGLLAKLKSGP